MNISDPHVPLRPTAPSPEERLFPTLTTAQITRIAARGRRRAIAPGEVLVEVGAKVVPFFVLVSGEIQVLQPSDGTETLIVTHRRGQFSGEGTMITGRRALARLRVSSSRRSWPLDRMPPLDSLVAGVRGEYSEMPGLRLTVSQACRLWQLETSTCETLLEQLVREGFLYKTDNGAYMALATSRC